METIDLFQEIASLPAEAQKQVINFIAFLKTQYPATPPTRKSHQEKLTDEPFIGMWKDREDMQDSSLWVKNLRQREWERDR